MVTGPELLIDNVDEQEDYLGIKWTYEEYLEELKKPIEYPDPNDFTDARYYKKYAHNVPPPEAYYIVPDRKDQVATSEKTQNDRKLHFGWNNVTEYEDHGVK